MRTLDYAIVFVSDMKRSIGFYREVFGLTLKFESPEWSEFVAPAGNTTIALHRGEVPKHSAEGCEAGRCQLGFHVPDLTAFHQSSVSKGVKCLTKPKDESFGKLAVYADPDGLGVTVLQPASH